MALPQQKMREVVFQLIYSHDFSNPSDEEMADLLMPHLKLTKSAMRLAQERRLKVKEKLYEIDQFISEASAAYEFDRIPRIERNILRLGVFELLFDEEIPPKVAMAEAIRMTRKFASPEGATFVNAVLDAIYHSKAKKETTPHDDCIACSKG